MANPFQQGQQAERTLQSSRDTHNASMAEQERQAKEFANKQIGLTALQKTHGDKAFAANEAQALEGGVRADQRLENDEAATKLKNSRNAEGDARGRTEDAQDDEDRQGKRHIKAMQSAVGFYKSVIAKGGDLDEATRTAGPTLLQMGMTQEELDAFPQQLRDNPDLIDHLEAAVTDQAKAVNAKVTGQPTPVLFDDDTTGLINTFTDGRPPEILEGVRPLRQEITQQRVNQGEADAKGNAKFAETVAKGAGERISADYDVARQSLASVKVLDRSLSLLDEGIRSGSFGAGRQEAKRFFADFLGMSDDQIVDTDEFFGLMGIAVAEQIKAFGAGTGLSDADREFAKRIVGGSQDLDPRAIRRLVRIQRDVAVKRISNYNEGRKILAEKSPAQAALFPELETPSKIGDEKHVRVYNIETGEFEDK
jgi:hypothetical protein